MWSTDVFTSVFVVKALNQPWHWFNFWWRLSRFSVDDTVVRNYGCFTGLWFCFFISWDLEAIAAYNAVKVWVVLSSPVSPGREWCFLVFTGTDLEKESRKWTAGWLVCSSNEGGPDTGLHALFSTKAYQTKQNSLLASSRFFSPPRSLHLFVSGGLFLWTNQIILLHLWSWSVWYCLCCSQTSNLTATCL